MSGLKPEAIHEFENSGIPANFPGSRDKNGLEGGWIKQHCLATLFLRLVKCCVSKFQ